MKYAIYSQTQSDRTVSIRIERNGAVLFFAKSLHGEVIQSDEIAIDPAHAAWLVDAIALELPYLNTGWGHTKVGFGEGANPPEMRAVDEATFNAHRFQGVSGARELLGRLQSSARQHRNQKRAEPVMPSNRRAVEPLEVVIAAISFIAAHFAIGTGAMMLIPMISDPILGLGMFLVCGLAGTAGAYFGGGYITAQLCDGNGYKTALYASALSILFHVLLAFAGGESLSICVVWLMPFLARWGASSAGAHP